MSEKIGLRKLSDFKIGDWVRYFKKSYNGITDFGTITGIYGNRITVIWVSADWMVMDYTSSELIKLSEEEAMLYLLES